MNENHTQNQKDTASVKTKKFKLVTTAKEVFNSILLILSGIVITITAVVVYVGVKYSMSIGEFVGTLKEYSPFFEAKAYVDNSFYIGFSEDTLLDATINGYISGLDDKFSRYESPNNFTQSQIKNAGESIGIGITVTLTEDGYIHVEGVTEGMPADVSGIKVDDIIKSINGNDVAELGYDEAIKLIKEGEENSMVNLTILRGTQTLSIDVNRTIMEVTTANGEMLENNIGYIKITHFYTNTPEQFNKAYQELLSQGAKAFIFDLRNNTGGYTNSVQGCLNDLVPKGNIAEAKYNNGKVQTIVAYDSDATITVPSVILTNGMTASASELFSSAMRELEGSILVGENTYGKGVMQTTKPLSNGGAVVLTVATYNIVGHECYHGVGLAPDYEVSLEEDATEDTQLNKALEVANTLISQ